MSCEMDVRAGGGWHRRMRVPDGSVVTKYGVYREVTSPERLVFTYNTEYADGTIDPETLVTVTFDDLGRPHATHAAPCRFWDGGVRASAIPAAGPAPWTASSISSPA